MHDRALPGKAKFNREEAIGFHLTHFSGKSQVHPSGTRAATTTAVGPSWVGLEPCLRCWTSTARGSGWMSAPQQLAAGASQCLPCRVMASASSAPWQMWHAYKNLRGCLTPSALICPARLLRLALERSTKSTSS
jgi:hypothetical protein